jgi:hypothetical protein
MEEYSAIGVDQMHHGIEAIQQLIGSGDSTGIIKNGGEEEQEL